jgi:hypothetical protein
VYIIFWTSATVVFRGEDLVSANGVKKQEVMIIIECCHKRSLMRTFMHNTEGDFTKALLFLEVGYSFTSGRYTYSALKNGLQGGR